MFADFVSGFLAVMMPGNLALLTLGVALGILVGALPGLSATMAIALLLPVTFAMEPAAGISMLAAIYMAALWAGSIPAILLGTPGTPAAAATVLDGYPLARNGQAGKALGTALVASFIGGLFSSIVLMSVAPLIARVAIMFGPPEYFALAIFGLTLIASLSKGSTIKGLISGFGGLLFAMVGMDTLTGYPRFSFGQIELYGGIPYVAALIGLFSISQALNLVEEVPPAGDAKETVSALELMKQRILPTIAEFRSVAVTIARSSVIGVIVGAIPGTGGDIATWAGYNEARRFSKNRDKFGSGCLEGVAASEGANNAAGGGAMIPMLTLGIPGSAATAMLLGGLLIHGIRPGPLLMIEYADIAYTFLVAVLVANILMLVLGIGLVRVAVFVSQVPNRILSPIIVSLSVIGAYAVANSIFDVYLMVVFGALGYGMIKVGMPVAPMVLGIILGPMADSSLARSLILSRGSWTIFALRPISATLLAAAFLSMAATIIIDLRQSAQAKRVRIATETEE